MTIELGVALGVDAESFGQPGERTFRLRVLGASREWASLWVEKEQMQALSLALSQMLAQLRQAEQPGAHLADFPDAAEHDIHVGRMEIGFDSNDRTIVLNIYALGADDDEPNPDLRVRFRQEQCASLSVELKRIIAAGRPLCPLCGTPLTPGGHACIRANGHSTQPVPERGEEEEP
jgi:uncharacterized repeat protein (TIGR03847 family)